MDHNNTSFFAGFSAPEDVDYLKWVSETKKSRLPQPEAKKELLEDLQDSQRIVPPDSVKKQNHPPPPCSGSSLSQESGVENPGYLRYDDRITDETQCTLII